jgi:hypothetical protein
MYGCEYYRDGKLYRKSPDQDMDSLLRYMQAPNPGEELIIVKDKAKSTMVSLFINIPIQQQEDLTIEYGGPYWQIFWNHLSLDHKRQIKIQYPDITFPPHWNTIYEDDRSTGAPSQVTHPKPAPYNLGH